MLNMIMTNLEKIAEQPLTLEKIREIAAGENLEIIELKFKGNVSYLRLEGNGKEYFCYKRRDGDWYFLLGCCGRFK